LAADISAGRALSRLAYAAVRDAAPAMREGNTFGWVREFVPIKDFKTIFSR
jgi:hypothetical protein